MARYDRLAYAAALVLGWDIFVAFLADELLGYLEGRFGHRETFRKIHDQEVPRLRDFPSMSGRYGHWVGLDLASLWTALDEIRATRNAIVHNVGCYTADYLALPSRRLPEDNSFLRDASPDWLLNQELIPLNEAYVRSSLAELGTVAIAVREHMRRQLSPDECIEAGFYWLDTDKIWPSKPS